MRTLQMLVLLVFACTQAAAAECPMTAPATPPAHAMADAHPMHHTGAHHAPAHHAHDAQRADCALVMACGAAAVAASEIVSAPAAIAVHDPIARPAAAYASPFIPTLAPPPRRALPA
jgi:hypothetical protein